MDVQDRLADQVKGAIVRCLRMPIKPEEIQDDMPLFDEGLGLDSIDALEIVLELQRSFGVEISDEQVGKRVLRSVSSIVQFIEANRNGARSSPACAIA
jgi:acyl carrier protein